MSRARFREVWREAGPEYRVGLSLVMLGCLGAVSGGVLLAIGTGWWGVLVVVLALTVLVTGNVMRVRAFKTYLNR